MRKLLFICWFLTLNINAHAEVEAWTNQAGHVIYAELVDYESDIATLKTDQASNLHIPLAALCKQDQQRIRLLHDEPIVPTCVQAAYRDAKAILTRYDELAGKREETEERRRVRNLAHAIFDDRIAAHRAMCDDPVVRNEIIRIRELLQ